MQFPIPIYQWLLQEMTTVDFKRMVYEDHSLRAYLGEDNYWELASMYSFHTESAVQRAREWFLDKIDLADFELYKLKRLLSSIQQKDENAYENLQASYRYRNDGYWFLEKIAMNTAILISKYPSPNLTDEQKAEVLEKSYPAAALEAQRIASLLIAQKIVPLGKTTGELSRQMYIDTRTPSEIPAEEARTLRWIMEGGLPNWVNE